MPTLRNLLTEMLRLSVDSGEIRIPAALYDDFLDEVEGTSEKNPTKSTEDDD